MMGSRMLWQCDMRHDDASRPILEYSSPINLMLIMASRRLWCVSWIKISKWGGSDFDSRDSQEFARRFQYQLCKLVCCQLFLY